MQVNSFCSGEARISSHITPAFDIAAAGRGIQPRMDAALVAMFRHLAWADARLINHLRSAPGIAAESGASRLLAHVVAAERVWLLRLEGQDSSAQPIWPEWSLDDISPVATANAAAYASLVERLTAADGERIVEYRNSQGVPFQTAVLNILLQVALHGSYHRGQIAAALRQHGTAPVNTDYITFVRERTP
jgi:uncharacterized damage-inducible protein DinB